MPELQVSGVETFSTRLDDLLDVYRQAFLEVYESDPERATRERRALMQQHQNRSGLRLAFLDDEDCTIAGFCYTYRSSPGQWWHDVISRALDREARATWLGNCREVVELHVRPRSQGHGLGRQLLRAALSDIPESTAILSALDLPGSRAQRLYASEGFIPILDHFRFPASDSRYVILGKPLMSQAESVIEAS